MGPSPKELVTVREGSVTLFLSFAGPGRFSPAGGLPEAETGSQEQIDSCS